jgi:DNA repair protein RecN (Recombination protein N)
MLRELSVQNLALIEDVRVELQPGFCAWTGETGAGKSLLLGALGLLLGDRGNPELLRTGCDELRVTGCFELSRPELRQALEPILDRPAEEQIILSRRLLKSGGSKAYIDEVPVSINTLKQVGEVLVDIHGQRESYSLLQPGYQLQLLDRFGGLEPLREKYQKPAQRLRDLRTRYRELSEKQQARQRELTLIRFEREELEQAKLIPGEQEKLSQELNTLTHAQSLQEFTAKAAAQLYDDDGSLLEQFGKLLKEAEHWGQFDPRVAEVAQQMEALAPQIRDVADSCRDLADRFAADPERLDEVEKRLQLIRKLELKYKKPIEALIEYRTTLDEQEQRLQGDENDLGTLQGEIEATFAELKSAAESLSKARSKVAKKLASETQKHLANLGMPSARLDTGLEPIPLGDDPYSLEIPTHGADHLELMLAANPGEPPRPLRKVASGGEMSRTMLALKTVLASHDPVGTLVFDEIDANVGGRLGDILGEKLASLGNTHQVICVTHLPQVASYAQHHWTIRKQSKGKRTSTVITPLDSDAARIEELASMLRGESKSETTRKEAEEMLRAAHAGER